MGMSEFDTFLNVKRVPAEVTRDEALACMGPDTQARDASGMGSMLASMFPMALEDTFDGFVVDPDTLEAEHFDTTDGGCRYVVPRPASELAGRP